MCRRRKFVVHEQAIQQLLDQRGAARFSRWPHDSIAGSPHGLSPWPGDACVDCFAIGSHVLRRRPATKLPGSGTT